MEILARSPVGTCQPVCRTTNDKVYPKQTSLFIFQGKRFDVITTG